MEARKLGLGVLIIAATAVIAAAQSPVPTPPGDQDVVRISTNLIQVDVTVTDKSGKVIRDLRSDEIEIYENGKRQKLANFSFVTNVREGSRVESRPVQTAPGVPAAPVRPEQVRRTIALVVDDSALSFEDIVHARRALKKFVDGQMLQGDLVAIIRTAGGVGALQQFTTDRKLLHSAIDRIVWNPLGSGGINTFEPLRPTGEFLGEDAPTGVRTTEDIERDIKDTKNDLTASGTFGSLNYIIRGLGTLPGRKSVIFLSPGFPLVRESRDAFREGREGFLETTPYLQVIRDVIERANRESVVIYAVDPRGLQTAGLTAADSTAERTAATVQNDMRDRLQTLKDTQDGLKYLAEETGGFAVLNNNDIAAGVERVLDDQSYYLLGYEPEGDDFDATTRRGSKLEIKVNRPGTTVRYRSAFYGVGEGRRTDSATTSVPNRLLNALTSPFDANQLSLRVNALFGRDSAKRPIVRTLLHVDAQNIVVTNAPGNKKRLKFDLIAAVFGDNNTVSDEISKTYTASLSAHEYASFIRRGFVYDFAFEIKKPGAYQLRVAIRDHGSDKIGSASQFVEVPDLSKGRLTLSGVALENIPFAEWERRNGLPAGGIWGGSNPLMDTSLREFKTGTVLNYGFTIFNARPGSNQQPDLVSKSRLYKDGKLIFDGQQQPVSFARQKDPNAVHFMSSLKLGQTLGTGQYALEIIITDRLAKGSAASARTFVQFALTD